MWFNSLRLKGLASFGPMAFGCVLWSTAAPGQGVRGDFNGDGFDDLVVAAVQEDLGRNDEGAVHVLYGSAGGVETADSQFFSLGRGGLPGVSRKSASFGAGLAVGDFDTDGFDDLAIGVPNIEVEGNASAGMVIVIYGSGTGLDTGRSQSWSQEVLRGRFERGDHFGEALAAGDFDDDGFDDLVVGVTTESVSGNVAAGALNVVFGSGVGLIAAGNQWISQDTARVRGEAAPFERFANSLSVGDFNGDGVADLAVGIAKDNVTTRRAAGAVQFFFGATDVGLDTAGNFILTTDNSGLGGDSSELENFGWSMVSADFDADGCDDIAIGARGDVVEDVWRAGSVFVLYGSRNGPLVRGSQVWNQGIRQLRSVPERDEAFGSSVSAGDFDGDGFADLAIGVPGEMVENHPEAGAVHVLFGTSNGLVARDGEYWTQESRGLDSRADDFDRFGQSSTVGDFNGDGFTDLVIGAPDENVGNIRDAGAIQVIYGTANGLTGRRSQTIHQNSPGVRSRAERDDRFGTFGAW